MDLKKEAAEKECAKSPKKAHRSCLRERIMRRMKNWCNGLAGGAGRRDVDLSSAIVVLPLAERPRTRDLLTWKRQFEMAVGDGRRASPKTTACSAARDRDREDDEENQRQQKQQQQQREIEQTAAVGTELDGGRRRSKSAGGNLQEGVRMGCQRSRSAVSRKQGGGASMMLRFLRELMKPRSALDRSTSCVLLSAFDDFPANARKFVSFDDLRF